MEFVHPTLRVKLQRMGTQAVLGGWERTGNGSGRVVGIVWAVGVGGWFRGPSTALRFAQDDGSNSWTLCYLPSGVVMGLGGGVWVFSHFSKGMVKAKSSFFMSRVWIILT